MRQHQKKITSAIIAGLFATAAGSVHATSSYFEPKVLVGESQNKQPTQVAFYDYPAPSTVTETGILFFYSEAVLRDYFDGDPIALYNFIDESIAVNNETLARGGIGLSRKSVGVLPISDDFVDAELYTAEPSVVRYFTEIASGEPGSAAMSNAFGQYGASYYVMIAKRDTDDVNAFVGKATLGGDSAVVTPYENTQHSVTIMAHELGHNDGLRHNRESDTTTPYMLATYAVGDRCDTNYSIMDSRGFSYTDEHFFSDPAHSDIDTGEACGELQVADAAAAYREGVAKIEEKRAETPTDFSWALRNIVDMNDINGLATIDVGSAFVDESTGALTGSVLWSRFDAANASQDGVPHGSFELVVDYDASTISKDDIVGDGIIPLTYDGTGRTNFSIELVNDDEFEVSETLVLRVMNPNGVEINNDVKSVTYTIGSDDVGNAGTFSFSQASKTVNEGSSSFVDIIRENGSDGAVAVNVKSFNGTAVAGEDYTAIDTTVNFEPGETSKRIAIATMTDATEDDESFTLRIVNDNINVDVNEVVININDTTDNNGGGNDGGNNGGGNNGGNTGGSSGGGSMGWMAVLLAGACIWRRKK